MSDDIAGLTRRAPQASYEATVPGVGRVTLRRERSQHFNLALDLDPAFAATLSTGNGATAITLPGPRPSRSVVGDLRALLVDHRLLQRPELLSSTSAPLPDASAEVREARDALQTALIMTISRPESLHKFRCPSCPAPAAPAAPRAVHNYYGYGYAPRVTEDCAHVALYPRVLSSLMATHPELTFEFAGLTAPDAYENPTRFVLTGEVMLGLLAAWLLPGDEDARARRAYTAGRWDWGYGRARRKKPRAAAVRIAWEGVPEAQRAGLTFAARAWQCEADAPRFARRPEGAVAVAPWQPTDATTALDLAVLLPEEFRLPAAPPPRAAPPKPAAPEAAPTKPAKRVVKRVAEAPKAAPAPPSDAPSAPAKLYTMKDLAALGHSATEVKKMLKSGVIERESFGWYRFAKR